MTKIVSAQMDGCFSLRRTSRAAIGQAPCGTTARQSRARLQTRDGPKMLAVVDGSTSVHTKLSVNLQCWGETFAQLFIWWNFPTVQHWLCDIKVSGGVSKDCNLIKKCVTGVELDDGVGDALLFGESGNESTMKANVSNFWFIIK